MITANNVLITLTAGTWELLINYQYFKQPIDPIIITKLFKKCSISNDLDGMEDDVLWAEQYDTSNIDSKEEGDDMFLMKW